MLIKVCGMREPGNIEQVASISGVDLIGLIFYDRSPRYVDSTETALSVASLTTVKVIGVFVNPTPDEVAAKCMDYHLDYIQLHGIETPEYLISLRQQLPEKVKIIKAFSIQNAEDLEQVSGYEGLCDYFLFDTKTSDYGGSGEAFDWNILQQYKGFTEFLLSGGIAPDSLEALSRFKHKLCAGVDLNSRFEKAPGMKNIPLLKEFVQQLKQNKQ
ncbi:MAG: phosphoribosylanthranilate isomerase [Prolixibacteraceae bacterium]|jgi:phosphoribosylanthranilate isomerase|nr:phosphoribosylanthranilate isomerase [Prolixibacteraceae bacterium]